MKFNNFVDVEKEYEKNEELTRDDIDLLKEWLVKQPHLPQISDLYLMLFLHSCYYKIESTKKCIETFYTIRAHCPEFFSKRSSAEYSKTFDQVLFTPLPKLSIQGYQIIFCKFTDSNTDNFVLAEAIKSFDMTATLTLQQTGPVAGHALLIDLKGMSFGHVTKMNPVLVKKFLIYLQEALPFRLKVMYFINIPSYMDKVLAIIKPFLKKELLNTMMMYTDKFDEIYKYIPKECFPSDYGGEADAIDILQKKWKENLLANDSFFVEDQKEMADESRRMGKSSNIENIFGVEGTFKKLSID